jgi:hypothetical protein
LQRLADQSHEAIRALAEIDGLRGHQDLNSRSNRNHVAAFTARSTSRSQPRSTPRSARTSAPAISMLMVPDRFAAAAETPSSRGLPHNRYKHRRLVSRQRQKTGPGRLAPAKQVLRRHVVSARHL